MTGSSFVHEKRGSMTPLRALRIFEACGGKCAKCQRKLTASDSWDVDHVTALCNGGTDEDSNLQVLCDWCHGDKTADDVAQAAKGKRMAAKAFVPKRFKKSRGWR